MEIKIITFFILLLPPLHDVIKKEAINISFDLNSKIPEFLNECGKYELKSRANQLWYIELIEDVSRITPKLNRLLDLEIKHNQERYDRGELNHRIFSVDDLYREHSFWAFRLLQENLVENKKRSPSKELQKAYQLSKLRKILR